MLYNEKVITNASHSVGVYEGNLGKALMNEGKRLKLEGDKELEQAKKLEETSYKLNLSQGMNELATNQELMSNPQALGQEMDKLAQNVTANIQDDDMKVKVLTDFEISKGSYINKATTNMQRVQAENARSATYDSVYKGIDSLSTSFGNAISGNYDENDIVNYQYSLAKIKESVNARNLDGTYMFTDAQRRAMAKDADSAVINGFIDTYSKLPEAQRMAIASKLENDYFRISLGDDGFKYQGNIDLASRPVYRNEDGSVSTEVSRTFEFDGKHVILPTIKTVNGRGVNMTDAEAVEEFRSSGLHLGVYNSKAEAEKAAEAIHNRGEKGVDLKDIVGETGYNDIKRAVAKYDSALKAEQIKQFNAEKKASIVSFLQNPTEEGLKTVRLLNAGMSEKTYADLEQVLLDDPDYQAEQKTMFSDFTSANNAIMEFAELDFENDEEQFKAVTDIVNKMNKSCKKNKLTVDDISQLKGSLLTAMTNDAVRANMREIKPYYTNFWDTLLTFSPTYDNMKIKKQMEDFAEPLQRQVIDGISKGASAEDMKRFLQQSRRKLINFKYPPIEGKEIGDIMELRGVSYKVISIDPVPVLEPVK